MPKRARAVQRWLLFFVAAAATAAGTLALDRLTHPPHDRAQRTIGQPDPIREMR